MSLVVEEAPPAAVVADGLRVATRMVLDTTVDEAWQRLMFYEQLDERPPLHLRLLLPVPIESVGRKSQVGDEVHCRYEGGHLIKRITQIEPGRAYVFEVIEQALDVGGGMVLAGGSYALRELAPGRVEVTVVTRYRSPKRPRWLWQPLESAVCHAFHRHILRAMRRALARPRGAA